MQKKPVNLSTPRVLRAGPVLWLVLCWLMLAGAAAGLIFWASLEVHPNHAVFKGTLAPEMERQDVILAAHIPVADLLVAEGDIVTKGQAILHYDADTLLLERETLEAKIRQNIAERRCLLDADAPETVETTAPESDLTASDLFLQTAIARCTARHGENRLEQQSIQHSIEKLRHNYRTTQNTPLPSAKGQDQVSALLAQDIKLQAILISLERKRIALQTLIAQQNSDLADSVRLLVEQHRELQRRQDRLTKLLNDPFLRAPIAGEVRKLRDLPSDTTFEFDVTIAQLSRTGNNRIATAQVSEPMANAIREGDPASLRLSGLPLSAPPVPARVARITPVAGSIDVERPYELALKLHADEISDSLWQARVRRYLQTMDGRATATIRMTDMPMLEQIKRSLRLVPTPTHPVNLALKSDEG